MTCYTYCIKIQNLVHQRPSNAKAGGNLPDDFDRGPGRETCE